VDGARRERGDADRDEGAKRGGDEGDREKRKAEGKGLATESTEK
jgi:hypothetical protein